MHGVFKSFYCHAENIILDCHSEKNWQALLCWREQKAVSHVFVLSQKYFLANIRWAYDRLLFPRFFSEWTDAKQHVCPCQ